LGLKLAEKYKIKKLILVAGWDEWDKTPEHETFFKDDIDHQKIRGNVKDIVVIHSDNDPYISKVVAEKMAKKLGARFILMPGRGHFTKSDGEMAILREVL
jgi:predicted alpha/beta hydrolase family esterase